VPRVVSVAPVLAPHPYPQEQISATFRSVVGLEPDRQALLDRLHAATGVRCRHLALPLERYATLTSFGEANDAYIDVGLDLAERAVKEALQGAGLAPDDVDLLMTVSVTGIAAPSLDARLVARLGLRPDLRRVPVFGLGCVAGAAGVARMADLLQGRPDGVGVLLSVELCSLTVQRDDVSTANLIASGLFGDGAAAVVVVGQQRAESLGLPGAAVVDSRAALYPDTEDVMGWDISGSGFRVLLSPRVPDMVRSHVGEDVTAFLAAHRSGIGDVDRWVAHPGGPKVLDALAETLAVMPEAFAPTWRSLERSGNLSSASVLHVLADVMAAQPQPGETGVMLAMGPGFCSEQVLLRW
jgi:alkylresorcinol/alkylpyrone synthase